MIKLATWNIRGLNDPCKHIEIRKFIFDYRLDLVCIVENKVMNCNIDRVRKLCIHNAPINGLGRVWICWNPLVLDVQMLNLNGQSIDCHVIHRASKKEFTLTGVYGCNMREERYGLWRDLRTSFNAVVDRPWILLGDFNIVRKPEERRGANPVDRAEMEDFNQCLSDIQVQGMNYKVFAYTWDSKRSDNMLSRIDIVLQNDGWSQLFPNTEAEVLAAGISDHCPIWLPLLMATGGVEELLGFLIFGRNMLSFRLFLGILGVKIVMVWICISCILN